MIYQKAVILFNVLWCFDKILTEKLRKRYQIDSFYIYLRCKTKVVTA